MNHDSILAKLNFHAVLPNLEELVQKDSTAANMVRDWNICIQFIVRSGPKAFVNFQNGSCEVGMGKHPKANIKLFFLSCRHLNNMIDGNATPIPIKGFTKIPFLTKEFTKITERMEFFLKPTDDLLKKDDYITINTLLTIHTAARAVTILAEEDTIGKAVASGIQDGPLVMKVLPDGPAVSLVFKNGKAEMKKGETKEPSAFLFMRNMKIANDLLNQKIDPTAAIALGDLEIKGMVPMVDAMDLILDRIPYYLEQ